MKKSILKNSDIFVPLMFATLLITLICYNIIAHGIINNTAFQF